MEIAQFLAELGPWLIIEFVPKQDSQTQKLLASREDIFPEYRMEKFEEVFSDTFQILEKYPIHGTERCLFLMKRRI